jgi:hypothetical protein
MSRWLARLGWMALGSAVTLGPLMFWWMYLLSGEGER